MPAGMITCSRPTPASIEAVNCPAARQRQVDITDPGVDVQAANLQVRQVNLRVAHAGIQRQLDGDIGVELQVPALAAEGGT